MLILSRKRGQSIIINQNIEIFVTSIEGDQVKIGISAPREYQVLRKEVIEDVKLTNLESVSTMNDIFQLKEWVNGHGSDKK